MKEWEKELREELRPGLVARTEDGREILVELDFDRRAGALGLQWKAMAKRLYPADRRKRRKNGTG
jgi:hypothetical protein